MGNRGTWRGVVLAIHLVLFFSLAAWLRVASLETVPGHNGDESFYGSIAARLASGKGFAHRTASGNLINPFLAAIEAVPHLVSDPSLLLLRIPSALCGILVVALAYRRLGRVLDPATGLLTATILAALPINNLISRIALEQSQIPLVGVVALVCAFKPHRLGLGLVLAAGLLVHPTNVFLVPIVLPVLLARLWAVHRDDAPRRRRIVLGTSAALIALAVAFAVILLQRPDVRARIPGPTQIANLEWLHFLNQFAWYMFSPLWPVGASRGLWIAWTLFWAGLIVAADFGIRRLVRNGQWDRLGLIVGTLATLVAFHAVAGSRVFDRSEGRYAVVFIVPLAVSFACLLRTFFPLPTVDVQGRWWPVLTADTRYLAVLSLAWILLLSPPRGQGIDSLWSLQSRTLDPYRQALQVVRRDGQVRAASLRAGTAPQAARVSPLLLCEDYWVYRPLRYYTERDRRMRLVESINTYDMWCYSIGDHGTYDRKVDSILTLFRNHRGYVVTRPDAYLDRAVRERIPAGDVKRWEVKPTPDGPPTLLIYRLRDPAVPVASKPGESAEAGNRRR